jgi:hypothetical protein
VLPHQSSLPDDNAAVRKAESWRYSIGAAFSPGPIRKGISGAAKCFCVKTGVIDFEWSYKLIACFVQYVDIVTDVIGEDY